MAGSEVDQLPLFTELRGHGTQREMGLGGSCSHLLGVRERRGGEALINSDPDPSLELPVARGTLSSQLTQTCCFSD